MLKQRKYRASLETPCHRLPFGYFAFVLQVPPEAVVHKMKQDSVDKAKIDMLELLVDEDASTIMLEQHLL